MDQKSPVNLFRKKLRKILIIHGLIINYLLQLVLTRIFQPMKILVLGSMGTTGFSQIEISQAKYRVIGLQILSFVRGTK